MFSGIEFAVFARVFLVFRAYSGFEHAAGLFAGHAAVGRLFFRLLVLLGFLGLLSLVLLLGLLFLLVDGLVLWLILLLFLLLLFLLLFLPFFPGHLQVHLRIGITRAEAEAVLVGIDGLFKFLLFKIRITEIVESIGANGRVFGLPGRLVKIIFRGGIVALLINGITGVVPDNGVVLLFLSGLPVSLFCFAVMGVLILPVALPLELTDRLGVGGIAGKKQY